MHHSPDRLTAIEVFSIADIARAAGLHAAEAAARLRAAGLAPSARYVALPEAARLVRILTGRTAPTDADRVPLRLLHHAPRQSGSSLVASGLLHTALILAFTTAATLGLLSAPDTETVIRRPPSRLVYTVSLGPGGGGGGGGLESPLPPPRAERADPVRRVSSPAPVSRPIPPPPRRAIARPAPPVRPIRPDPVPAPAQPALPPHQILVAPVVQVPGDARDVAGLLSGPPARSASPAGPGSGGGAGSGRGTGIGEGTGAGLGPGNGGGTGGGPYRPGSGVTPPELRREVRPEYTTEARRQSIEGDVDLEIVVRADGSVGDVRLVRGLGAGLDQKAIEAVRQWRFAPARRQGAAVDVVVQVSVAFTLR